MAQWYYQVMDEILGPVSPDELKERIGGGEIDGGSLVRQDVGGEWVLVSDVEELRQAIIEPVGEDCSLAKITSDPEIAFEAAAAGDAVKRSPLSLRPCSDCGTMVSKQASVCPNYGRSFHVSSIEVRYKGEQPVPVLVFFAILAMGFVALSPMVAYFVAGSIADGFGGNSDECMKTGLGVAGLHLVSMVACTLLGGAVGKPRMAYVTGLFLGLFFGPLGVFVASAVDKRPKCGQCFSRLSGLSRECPSCHSWLTWKVETSWY